MNSSRAHYLWLFALILSTFWFGGVRPAGQGIIGILIGLALIGTARESRNRGPWLFFILIGIVSLQLIPLPFSVLEALNSKRADLSKLHEDPLGSTLFTLSYASGRSLNGLHHLALVTSFFVLSRRAAQSPHWSTALLFSLAVASILLVASDIWYQLNGKKMILGLWEVSWGSGAGTFANRNHYANWLCTTALFCMGALWQGISKLKNNTSLKFSRIQHFFIAVAVVSSLSAALLSGSRGAALSLLIAFLTVYIFLLQKGSPDRGILFVAGIGLAIVFILSGKTVVERLTSGELAQRSVLKLNIWSDSWQIAENHPFIGTGLGTFATAFNIHKTFGGEGTFWHAENDFIQAIVEFGFPVAFCMFFLLVQYLLKLFRRIHSDAHKRTDSEDLIPNGILVCGGAAILFFLLHACVEFPFQIPANAFLIATIMGYLSSSEKTPIISPINQNLLRRQVLLGCLLTAVGLMQTVSAYLAWQAPRQTTISAAAECMRRSLNFWPANSKSLLGWIRLSSEAQGTSMSEAQAKEILLRFDGFARLDPLNWELRLERLLFLSAHLPAQIKSEECLNLLHLNPLQPRLPLQLAQALAIRHPQIAIELLKKVGGRNPEILRSGLELASRISPDTDLLWQITPATLSGLETLGDYAVSKNLFGLAAAAYGQILNDLTPVKAAQKLLSAKQPERVLTLLATNETSSARLLKMEALLQLNHLQEVVDSAEILWGRSPQFENLTRAFPTSGSYEQISKNWVENQNDPVAALSLAEKIFLMPSSERNLELLKQLAQIASETRIHFIYYQTLKERSQLSEAAREAITLSRQILSSGQ